MPKAEDKKVCASNTLGADPCRCLQLHLNQILIAQPHIFCINYAFRSTHVNSMQWLRSRAETTSCLVDTNMLRFCVAEKNHLAGVYDVTRAHTLALPCNTLHGILQARFERTSSCAGLLCMMLQLFNDHRDLDHNDHLCRSASFCNRWQMLAGTRIS